jgi:hypothetical protein
MPVYGEPYQQPAVNPATGPMLDICREIAREFRGWAVTWTPIAGFTARKGADVIGPSSSRTALRCLIALAEHRMAR